MTVFPQPHGLPLRGKKPRQRGNSPLAPGHPNSDADAAARVLQPPSGVARKPLRRGFYTPIPAAAVAIRHWCWDAATKRSPRRRAAHLSRGKKTSQHRGETIYGTGSPASPVSNSPRPGASASATPRSSAWLNCPNALMATNRFRARGDPRCRHAGHEPDEREIVEWFYFGR